MDLLLIGIPKWDQFFGTVYKCSGNVAQLKGALVDRKHKIFYYLDLYKLKEFDICEALKIFLWTLSA